MPSRATLLLSTFLGPKREMLVEEPGLELSQKEAPGREMLVEKPWVGNAKRKVLGRKYSRRKVPGRECSQKGSPESSQRTPKHTLDRTPGYLRPFLQPTTAARARTYTRYQTGSTVCQRSSLP